MSDTSPQPTLEQYFEMRNHAVIQLKDFEKKIDSLISSQPDYIKQAIKEHVNGKIDKLTNTLNEYIRLDTERNQRKDEENAKRDEADKLWKKEFEPYIRGLANLALGGKIIVVFALGVTAVLGALYAVKEFFVRL